MSRREKRKAKYRVGDLVLIHHGQLSPRDQNFGLTVNCSVCSKVHKALGFARINADQSTTHVPLCEPCLAAATDDVVRKFWGAARP